MIAWILCLLNTGKTQFLMEENRLAQCEALLPPPLYWRQGEINIFYPMLIFPPECNMSVTLHVSTLLHIGKKQLLKYRSKFTTILEREALGKQPKKILAKSFTP